MRRTQASPSGVTIAALPVNAGFTSGHSISSASGTGGGGSRAPLPPTARTIGRPDRAICSHSSLSAFVTRIGVYATAAPAVRFPFAIQSRPYLPLRATATRPSGATAQSSLAVSGCCRNMTTRRVPRDEPPSCISGPLIIPSVSCRPDFRSHRTIATESRASRGRASPPFDTGMELPW